MLRDSVVAYLAPRDGLELPQAMCCAGAIAAATERLPLRLPPLTPGAIIQRTPSQ